MPGRSRKRVLKSLASAANAPAADRQRWVDEIAAEYGPEATRNFFAIAGKGLPDWVLAQLAEAQDGSIPTVAEFVDSNEWLGRVIEGVALPEDSAAGASGQKGGSKRGKDAADRLRPEPRSETAPNAPTARRSKSRG